MPKFQVDGSVARPTTTLVVKNFSYTLDAWSEDAAKTEALRRAVNDFDNLSSTGVGRTTKGTAYILNSTILEVPVYKPATTRAPAPAPEASYSRAKPAPLCPPGSDAYQTLSGRLVCVGSTSDWSTASRYVPASKPDCQCVRADDSYRRASHIRSW